VSTLRFERFLARLYTDGDLLRRFLADPMSTAARHGLDETERTWLRDVDRAGLVFANESFSRKRASRRQSRLERFVSAIRGRF
jgi:hypothetical protein